MARKALKKSRATYKKAQPKCRVGIRPPRLTLAERELIEAYRRHHPLVRGSK